MKKALRDSKDSKESEEELVPAPVQNMSVGMHPNLQNNNFYRIRKKSVNTEAKSPPGTAPNASKFGDIPLVSNRTPRVERPREAGGARGG